MPPARQSRRYGIVAASVLAHAALLAVLAVQSPRLRAPVETESGPPLAVIPVLILPRTPPATGVAGARPSPIRLHRRPQRFAPHPPIAPLIAPAAERPTDDRPAAPTGPRVLSLPTNEDALAANARNALRSRLNCDDPRLSRAEREGCWERFGARAGEAPEMGLGLDGAKESDLARAARRKEQDYIYKRSAVGGSGNVGSGRNAGAIERPGDPNKGMGASSQDIGRAAGNDSRGTLRAPF